MPEIHKYPTLSQILVRGNSANNTEIIDVAEPTTTDSATTKNYVDTAVATKEGTITAGTTAQYFRGDKTFVTLNTTIVPEGTNLYYTDVRADARITAQKGSANGIAPLDASSKIDASYLPSIAITDTFVVASQSAMLALTAQTGDVAVRTDVNKSFILAGTSASTLSDWQELLTPTDAVSSVNGLTGTVTLTTTNIGEGTNLYYTAARFNTAFSGKSTSDLAEGSNLYYTTARFDTALATKSTSNLTEGSNLYFTNARAIASTLTGYTSGAGTISSSDTILSAIQKLNANDATNANLTGPITSVGNTTSIASQTGTGSTFAMSVSPAFTGVIINTGTSSTTLGDVTGALRSGSMLIRSPYVAEGFSPAFYFSSTDDNANVPKAGIFSKTTGGGSYIYIGTSNSYVAGITTSIAIDPNGGMYVGDVSALAGSFSGKIALTGNPSFLSASSNAYIYHSTSLGLVMYGSGTSDDYTLAGPSGANILSIATGTTTARFYGAVNIGGTFTRRSQSGVLSQFQIEGTDFDTSSMSLFTNSTNGIVCPAFFMSRSRGATVGSNTIVQSGDRLGIMLFEGTDGTKPVPGVILQATVDGTPGTDDMPTRFEILTCPDGSSSPVINFTVRSTGAIEINNTVAAGVAVASTHKVTMVIGGTTYYLLASNV